MESTIQRVFQKLNNRSTKVEIKPVTTLDRVRDKIQKLAAKKAKAATKKMKVKSIKPRQKLKEQKQVAAVKQINEVLYDKKTTSSYKLDAVIKLLNQKDI